MSKFSASLLLALVLLSSSHWEAQAQTGDCSPYEDIAGSPSAQGAPTIAAIPDRLLTNTAVAIPCLIRTLRNLTAEITSPDLSDASRAKFLRATGALRTIFGNAQGEALKNAVAIFRNNDDRDVVSVLTWGVRSADHNARLNALLILGNVVDNTTVCVPIDHLYDPTLESDAEGPSRGRANLLGIISTVAPWAYKENYNAISNVRDYWASKQPKYKELTDVLQNITVRLGYNKINKNSPLKGDLSGCTTVYKPKWAKITEWMKD